MLVLILIIWSSYDCLAQLGKGASLESTFHVGKIYKHSPFLVFDVKDNSYGYEFNFTQKKYGKKEWHQYLNYPTTGLDLFFYQIGKKLLLEVPSEYYPISVFPFLTEKNSPFKFN